MVNITVKYMAVLWDPLCPLY